MEGNVVQSSGESSNNSPEVYQNIATEENTVASVLLVSNNIIKQLSKNKVISLDNIRNPQQNPNNLSIHNPNYKPGTGDKTSTKKKKRKNLYEELKIYDSNFKNLFEELNGTKISNEAIPILDCNYKFNVDKYINPYPFLKYSLKVLNESKIAITSLNESLTNLNINKVDSKIKKFDINDFKKDLGLVLKSLESNDETLKYSNDIVKIKTTLGISLKVLGFDIVKAIKENVFDKVLNNGILFSVVYSPSYKSLYFISINPLKTISEDKKEDKKENTEYGNDLNTQIITYSITEDKITYNNVTTPKFKTTNYLEVLKRVTGMSNLINIYTDLNYLNIKFNDNLYQDTRMADFRKSAELQKQYEMFRREVFG